MIARMNHVSVYVLDQDSAYKFYVDTLGFKVKTDAPMGPGMRWLTVCPEEQQDLEIVLIPIMEGPVLDKETADQLRTLIKKGTFGFGVFQCHDLNATYEEMKAKGVHFQKPPTKEFYGYEALFSDDSGNWFSLTEIAK